jgi:hypothetical protein
MGFRGVKGVDPERGVKAKTVINLRVEDGNPSYSDHFRKQEHITNWAAKVNCSEKATRHDGYGRKVSQLRT